MSRFPNLIALKLSNLLNSFLFVCKQVIRFLNTFKMMEMLIKQNEQVQNLMNLINAKINLLKKSGINTELYEIENKELTKANAELLARISLAKGDLSHVEIVSESKKQISVSETKVAEKEIAIKPETKRVETHQKTDEKQKAKKESKPKIENSTESGEVVDASKLDMRVGRIVEVTRHADADSLFIEKVDVGEAKPRQIISGLVKYCTEADLQGRLGVFLLNLKPAKMRGVLSEGMIMCASAPEQGKVEPLTVPQGANPGDRVTVEGYEGNPDEQLNPKKKIFDLIKPDLRVNAAGEATYKGARWQLNGQVGAIVAASLTDVQIA